MIEKITVDNCKEKELAFSFPQYFEEKNVKKCIENNIFTQIFTYTIDNQIVGFIQFDILYERAELIQIEVLNNFRHQQIASKLLGVMIDICIKNNVDNITLEVRKTNVVAIKLYEKFGFKKVAIRKKYYGIVDGILMEKEMIK